MGWFGWSPRDSAVAATVMALAVCLALASAVPAWAAPDAEAGTLRIESTDATDHPQVRATIVAPRSLADRELSADDVVVTEDGVAQPAAVAPIDGDGQQIVVAVDTSGSMAGAAMAAARDAAARFVASAPEDAEIAVVAFSASPTVVAPFTDDRQALAGAVGELDAGGNTALYDAVVTAAELFDGDAASRSVVVLSDGADTASVASLEQAGARAAAADARLTLVELVTAATDRAALEALAGHTDGTVLTAADPDELADLYTGAAIDLGNRYELSWRSSSYDRVELGVAVDADGVREQVGGHLLQLPEAPWTQRVLSSSAGLLLGLAACWAALAVPLVRTVRRSRARVGRQRLGMVLPVRSSALAGLTGRAVGLAEQGLGSRKLLDGLAAQLDAAGIRKRPGEFVVLCASAVAAAAALGLLLGGPVLMVALAIVTSLLPKVLLGSRAARRKTAFADQLEPTLQLLSGNLRAGHSLLQAVDAVSREAEEPTAAEFRRVLNATRVGRDLSEPLDDLATRMASDDFLWVTQAVAIHREVGGNLADVLDTVAATIRERNQIRRQVKALSAEGKLSAAVLMLLPVGIVGFLSVTNPGYLTGFTSSLAGYAMIAAAAVMLTAGGLWLRKTVQIQF